MDSFFSVLEIDKFQTKEDQKEKIHWMFSVPLVLKKEVGIEKISDNDT